MWSATADVEGASLDELSVAAETSSRVPRTIGSAEGPAEAAGLMGALMGPFTPGLAPWLTYTHCPLISAAGAAESPNNGRLVYNRRFAKYSSLMDLTTILYINGGTDNSRTAKDLRLAIHIEPLVTNQGDRVENGPVYADVAGQVPV